MKWHREFATGLLSRGSAAEIAYYGPLLHEDAERISQSLAQLNTLTPAPLSTTEQQTLDELEAFANLDVQQLTQRVGGNLLGTLTVTDTSNPSPRLDFNPADNPLGTLTVTDTSNLSPRLDFNPADNLLGTLTVTDTSNPCPRLDFNPADNPLGTLSVTTSVVQEAEQIVSSNPNCNPSADITSNSSCSAGGNLLGQTTQTPSNPGPSVTMCATHRPNCSADTDDSEL